jgi:hypothetical protein
VRHGHGPSPAGSVLLEVGEGAGVLIIRTGPAGYPREIEISLPGAAAERTHAAVRPRQLPGYTVFAAVYPGLRPGHYTVWRDPSTPHGSVRVAPGVITEYDWDRAG